VGRKRLITARCRLRNYRAKKSDDVPQCWRSSRVPATICRRDKLLAHYANCIRQRSASVNFHRGAMPGRTRRGKASGRNTRRRRGRNGPYGENTRGSKKNKCPRRRQITEAVSSLVNSLGVLRAREISTVTLLREFGVLKLHRCMTRDAACRNQPK